MTTINDSDLIMIPAYFSFFFLFVQFEPAPLCPMQYCECLDMYCGE